MGARTGAASDGKLANEEGIGGEAQGWCVGGGALCGWFRAILRYVSEIALTCVQPVEISIHHLYDLSVTHYQVARSDLPFCLFCPLFLRSSFSFFFISVSAVYSSVFASHSYPS